jgi:hypothetical protein
MQHTGGAFKKLSWHGEAWPPLAAFPDYSTEDDNMVRGCKVTKVSNVSFNKGTFSGYMSGKKTDDVLAKMVGVEVELPDSFAAGLSDDLVPFIKKFIAPDYTEGSSLDAVTLGDGKTFTFIGDTTLLSLLRADSGAVGDDPLQAGDEITITTRGKSLFLRGIELTKQNRNLAMRSQHAVQSMYVQKAVNVDEGLVQNMKGAEAQIAHLKMKAEEEAAKASNDVEDDEWD